LPCGLTPHQLRPAVRVAHRACVRKLTLSHKGRGRLAARLNVERAARGRSTFTSPLVGEDTKAVRDEVECLAEVGERFMQHLLIPHTSAFTRALLPRGLTMHVSRFLRFHGGSAGARNRATLNMTASRQPVRPVSAPRSVVFPTQLRSLCVTGCLGNTDASSSLRARDVTSSAIAGRPMLPVHHPRLASECLLCLTGTPSPFSGLRRTIFCAGHDSEVYVLPLHHQHRSRLDASPCAVAVAGRGNHLTGPEGGDEGD
jgi:hypothetical protein